MYKSYHTERKKIPDRHGAEDVEEDEAAVSHVVSQKVSMAQSLSHKRLYFQCTCTRSGILIFSEGKFISFKALLT